MSYQLCRWYDPYPRLSFALKLLYLAPGALQERASAELQKFLEEHWGSASTERVLYGYALDELEAHGPGKRWYDQKPDTAKTVELIKNSPESLKSQAADTLLAILGSDP